MNISLNIYIIYIYICTAYKKEHVNLRCVRVGLVWESICCQAELTMFDEHTCYNLIFLRYESATGGGAPGSARQRVQQQLWRRFNKKNRASWQTERDAKSIEWLLWTFLSHHLIVTGRREPGWFKSRLCEKMKPPSFASLIRHWPISKVTFISW